MTTLNYSTLFHFTFAVEFKFMSHLNDSTMKRRILFSVMCAVIAANTFAQGQGLAGINEATSAHIIEKRILFFIVESFR